MGIIKAGACIYLPDIGKEDEYHLHVVLNDPVGHPPTVALVSLSTTIDADKTTILNVGDHSFIDEETYVVYAWMVWKHVEKLEADILADMSKKHRHNCSPELLKRIQDGIFESSHTRPSAEKYCRKALNRPIVGY